MIVIWLSQPRQDKRLMSGYGQAMIKRVMFFSRWFSNWDSEGRTASM